MVMSSWLDSRNVGSGSSSGSSGRGNVGVSGRDGRGGLVVAIRYCWFDRGVW